MKLLQEKVLKKVNSLLIVAGLVFCLIGLITAPSFGKSYGPIEPTAGGAIDLPMNRMPKLPEQQTITLFSPRLNTLWLQALSRPEVDIRRRAAAAIAKAARQGMTGLGDTQSKLTALLKNDSNLGVRIAAARALVALNDQSAANVMVERLKKDGYPIARVVNPALAKWRFAGAIALWKKSIADKKTQRALLISDIQSLGAVKENSAATSLIRLAVDKLNPDVVRLAAARALGAGIGSSAVVKAAKNLARGDVPGRTLAAFMLNNHKQGPAVNLLFQLAGDDKAVVVAAALTSLNSAAPEQLARRAGQWLDAPDGLVRLQAIKSLGARNDKKSVQLLGSCLSDSNSNLRNTARKLLLDKNKQNQLHSAVLKVIKTNLASDNWGALEQAALLAKQIDDESVAGLLVQLLDYPRPEVRLAAATALRRFHLTATMPALLRRAEKLALMSTKGTKSKWIGRESTQLLQAFGLALYKPAEGLCRKYIPKSAPYTVTSRAAAIWALGKLHEGKLDKKLARQLTRRLLDNNMMNPEAPPVKRFSAIALGRMKAKGQLPKLQKVFSGSDMMMAGYTVQMACRWAIGQITGKLPPLPAPSKSQSTGWFLEPAK